QHRIGSRYSRIAPAASKRPALKKTCGRATAHAMPSRIWVLKRAPFAALPKAKVTASLLEVARHELGHLEHRHLFLAPENLPQFPVSIDQTLVDRILELVLLDVVPDLLGHFSARQRHAADDRCERARRRHRLHERGVRLALGTRLLRRLLRRGLLRRCFLRGLLGRLLGRRLLGALLGGLLCSFPGSSHSSPS